MAFLFFWPFLTDKIGLLIAQISKNLEYQQSSNQLTTIFGWVPVMEFILTTEIQ